MPVKKCQMQKSMFLNSGVTTMQTVKNPSQKDRILNALKSGPKTSAYFIDELRIFKYSSRIAELRKEHDIQATRIDGSLWQYELIEEWK